MKIQVDMPVFLLFKKERKEKNENENEEKNFYSNYWFDNNWNIANAN